MLSTVLLNKSLQHIHRRLLAGATRASQALHKLVTQVAYGDVLVLLRLPSAAMDRSFLRQVDGMQMRFLTPAEVRHFAAQGDTDLNLAYVDDALARGDRCFAVLEDDRLASYSWYATAPTGVTIELELHFPRPLIYMHHSFTAAAYRGRRLHTIGIVQALSTFEQDGPTTLLAIVSTSNAASMSSCQRAGYRPLGHFWLVGGVNRLGLYTSRAARAHGCWLAPRRNTFKLISLPATVPTDLAAGKVAS